MPNKTRDYQEWKLKKLSDPRIAAQYVNEAMADSPAMFLTALRNVAHAREIANVAKEAGVARENIYRAFSAQGNPTWDTLYSVLKVLDLKIAVCPRDDAVSSHQAATAASRISRKRRTNRTGTESFADLCQLTFTFPADVVSVPSSVSRIAEQPTAAKSQPLVFSNAPIRSQETAMFNPESLGVPPFFIPPAQSSGASIRLQR